MHVSICVNFVTLYPGAKITIRDFIFCLARPNAGAAADAAANVNNETPVRFAELACRMMEGLVCGLAESRQRYRADTYSGRIIKCTVDKPSPA